MKKKFIISILLISLTATFLNKISASQQQAVAAASVVTIIILYIILRNKLSEIINSYIVKFKTWISELNLKKNEAMKSLENAIDKECSTEKQIDEIAHHAHNNIQFLKKNSQEQIATFKKRAGDNFAMNAHAQKTQCNEEIKSHIINQINDHLYKFFVTHQANVGKKSCIENSLNKLENILNANDID